MLKKSLVVVCFCASVSFGQIYQAIDRTESFCTAYGSSNVAPYVVTDFRLLSSESNQTLAPTQFEANDTYTAPAYPDSLSYQSMQLRSMVSVSSSSYIFSNTDWTGYKILGSFAITALLLKTDQQTYDALYDWKRENAILRETSPMVTKLGDGMYSLGMFGGFMLYSAVFEDKKAFEVGKVGLESFALSGIVVQILKNTFSRERPSTATQSSGAFHGPLAYFNQGENRKGISHFDAFPSGHTTTVFAAATALSDMYTQPWVSYASYSLATGVAVSRITERTHWASDCFVGAIIGIFSTKLVERLNYHTTDFSIQPQAVEQQYGVLLTMKL